MRKGQFRLPHLVPLFAVQLAGLGCGLIGIRWTSSVVPPEVLGVFGLLLSTIQLGTVVTHQGLTACLKRTWTADCDRRHLGRIWRAFGHLPAGLLIVSLLALYGLMQLGDGPQIAGAWLPWMLAVNLLVVASTAAQTALQAAQKYWANFAVSALGSATRSFLPPLFAMLIGATLPVLGSAFLLHAGLLAAIAILALPHARGRPADPGLPDPESLRALTWSMMGVGLSAWVAGFAPRWFAVTLLDPATAGLFMLAINLATIVPSAASIVGLNYSFPTVFAAGRAGDDAASMMSATQKMVATVMVAAQAGLLLLHLAVPHLVGVLINVQYARAADWLLPAGGAVLMTVSGPFFCQLLLARQQNVACLWLTLASAAFRIAALAGLAVTAQGAYFAPGLILLPWPCLALEWGLTRHWLRRGRN